MKTAKLIQDNLETFRGHAALYQLSEPLDGHDFVIVSAVRVPSFVLETFIFPATEAGMAKDFLELEGSFTGGSDHSLALRKAGYSLEQKGA